MTSKQIFLSHIHEEKDLAVLIKQAIEDEFSGFIDVFVSSDGTSIPAGVNFLKSIEDGLVNCIGAIYLISPISVKRNWINFELGAVWIRNAINIRTEGNEVPTIPFCHSNMTLSKLPQPIGNLNAIIANEASLLKFAFKSLQTAVGGKGALRTNFDELAQKVVDFERKYTLGDAVKSFLSIFIDDFNKFVKEVEKLPADISTLILDLKVLPTEKAHKISQYEAQELKGRIKLTTGASGLATGSNGSFNAVDVTLEIDVNLVKDFKEILST